MSPREFIRLPQNWVLLTGNLILRHALQVMPSSYQPLGIQLMFQRLRAQGLAAAVGTDEKLIPNFSQIQPKSSSVESCLPRFRSGLTSTSPSWRCTCTSRSSSTSLSSTTATARPLRTRRRGHSTTPSTWDAIQ